jgi:hypothetical protein
MSLSRRVLIVLLMCGFAPWLFSQSARTEFEGVRRLETIRDLKVAKIQSTGSAKVVNRVYFQALGRGFELELEPSRLYTPGAVIRWVTKSGEYTEKPESKLYKGRVAGEEGSWVRMRVGPDSLEAVIRSEGELFFVRPGDGLMPGTRSRNHVAFRLSDVDSLWGENSCAVSSEPPEHRRNSSWVRRSARDDFRAIVDATRKQALAAGLMETEIHVVADSHYYNTFGSGAVARMESVINDTAGVYENDLGVTFKISGVTVYTGATDPLTDSTSPSSLLSSFTYDVNHTTGHDLAHLFTDRDLDGSTIGIAWLGTVCGSHGTGVSQDMSNSTYRMLLAAHELGHNFDAIHDGTGSCSGEPSDYIMWPSLQSDATGFSECSKGDIGAHVQSRSCLVELTSGHTDIAVWRPSTGRWHIIRSSDGTKYNVKYGIPGDIPVPGDFDGDSVTDVAVWRPSNGTWYAILSSNGVHTGAVWGDSGEIPIVGDYDGDSRADLTVWRPANGRWRMRRSSDGSTYGVTYGANGDVPVVGDFDAH